MFEGHFLKVHFFEALNTSFHESITQMMLQFFNTVFLSTNDWSNNGGAKCSFYNPYSPLSTLLFS